MAARNGGGDQLFAKVIVVGSAGVDAKTALVRQLGQGRAAPGGEYFTRTVTVDGITATLQIWGLCHTPHTQRNTKDRTPTHPETTQQKHQDKSDCGQWRGRCCAGHGLWWCAWT